VGLVGVVVSLFAVMFGCGFVGPSSVALALQRYPHAAGAASAVLGSFQFVLAGLAAPLAGIGGTSDALPMALLVTVLPLAALTIRFLLVGAGTRPGGIPAGRTSAAAAGTTAAAAAWATAEPG
jgi:DHA1 family bicyclomycin/chloramphenicol resistance-like MFS transporter